MKCHFVWMGLLGLCVVAGCEPPPGNSGLPQPRTARNGLEDRKVYQVSTPTPVVTQDTDCRSENGRPREMNDNLDLMEAVLTRYGRDPDSDN